jgi:hypothetical protein
VLLLLLVAHVVAALFCRYVWGRRAYNIYSRLYSDATISSTHHHQLVLLMSSSSQSSLSTEGMSDNVPWPPGGGQQKFLLLHVPELTDRLLCEALSFISNNCYIIENGKKKKKFLSLPGVRKGKGAPDTDEQIAMEYLLQQAIEEGATKTGNLDKFRYQSVPDEEEKLRNNRAVQNIVIHVTQVIQQHAKGYKVAKVSVLYSKPNGKPQGGHYDDYRTREQVDEEGEMVSVIVPLMDLTYMDIFNKDHRRIRLQVPKSMMLMFERNVLHGGGGRL